MKELIQKQLLSPSQNGQGYALVIGKSRSRALARNTA